MEEERSIVVFERKNLAENIWTSDGKRIMEISKKTMN
jgi:hypothetical protein